MYTSQSKCPLPPDTTIACTCRRFKAVKNILVKRNVEEKKKRRDIKRSVYLLVSTLYFLMQLLLGCVADSEKEVVTKTGERKMEKDENRREKEQKRR